MKRLLVVDIIILVFFIILPDVVARFILKKVFFEGDVVAFQDTVSHSSFYIILLAGISLIIYNIIFLKKNPLQRKTVPIIFTVIAILAIVYSGLVLLALSAFSSMQIG